MYLEYCSFTVFLSSSFPDEMRLANVARLALEMVNRNMYAMSLQVEEERRLRGEPVNAKVPDHVVAALFETGWGFRLTADGKVTKSLIDVQDPEETRSDLR